MKKLTKLLFIAIITIAVTYFGLIFTCIAFNEEAEAAIEKYAEAIDDYKLENGSYPPHIKDIEISRKKLFLFFSPIEIQYTHGEQPELWYGQIPLGPLRVYNLSSGEWSFAE